MQLNCLFLGVCVNGLSFAHLVQCVWHKYLLTVAIATRAFQEVEHPGLRLAFPPRLVRHLGCFQVTYEMFCLLAVVSNSHILRSLSTLHCPALSFFSIYCDRTLTSTENFTSCFGSNSLVLLFGDVCQVFFNCFEGSSKFASLLGRNAHKQRCSFVFF